jgi:hypothetical protein
MRVRNCNWRCYNAKSKDCRCQCNGINHGVGAPQARENFKNLGLAWKTPNVRRTPVQTIRKRRTFPGQGRLFV